MDNSAWKLFAIAGIIAVGCMVVMKVQNDLPLSSTEQTSDFEVPEGNDNFGYESQELPQATTDRFGFPEEQSEPGVNTASYDAVIDGQSEPGFGGGGGAAAAQTETPRGRYYEGENPFGQPADDSVAHAHQRDNFDDQPADGGHAGVAGFSSVGDNPAAGQPTAADTGAFPESPSEAFPGAEFANDPPMESSSAAPLDFPASPEDSRRPVAAAEPDFDFGDEPNPQPKSQPEPATESGFVEEPDNAFGDSRLPEPDPIESTFGDFPGFEDGGDSNSVAAEPPTPDGLSEMDSNPFPGADNVQFQDSPETDVSVQPSGFADEPVGEPGLEEPGFEFEEQPRDTTPRPAANAFQRQPAGDPLPTKSDDVVLGVSSSFEDAPDWPARETQPQARREPAAPVTQSTVPELRSPPVRNRVADENVDPAQYVEFLPDPTDQRPEAPATPFQPEYAPERQTVTPGAKPNPIRSAVSSATVPLTDSQGRATGSNAPVRLTGNGTIDPSATRGSLRPQLKIDKTAPGDATLGKPLIYQIVITNTGNARARQVVVEDRIPRGCQLTGTIPQARLAEDKLSWDLGAMEPGAKKTIAVRVIPTVEGEVGSVATVSFAADVSAATKITAPKLKVDMIGQEEVMLGEPVVYKYRLSNTGTGTASKVVIRNIIPACLEHPGGNDLEYEVGTLAAGGTEEITLKLTAIRATKTGVPNSNEAIVTAEGGIKASATMPIVVIGRQLALSRRGPARRYIGRRALYENTVKNESTRASTGAMVIEQIPAGMKFVEASGGGRYNQVKRTVSWTVPDLPPGQVHVMNVTMQAADGGQHESVVQVLERTGLQSEAKSKTAVEHLNTMGLEISEVDGPVAEGEKMRFTIRARNRGTAPATGVKLVVRVPAEMEIIGAGPIKAERIGDEIHFPPLKSVDVGTDANFTVSLQAKALPAGRSKADVRLMAQVKTNEMEKPLGTEEAILIYSATD